jgi:two-component system cell cycle sensor histidine kinase PleC
VGYGQRLKIQHAADGRVVKAQLDFICEDVGTTRYTVPIWTAIIAFIPTQAGGLGGHLSLTHWLGAVIVMSAAMLLSTRVVRAYQMASRRSQDYELMRVWFHRFFFFLIAVSIAWGMLPWFLWEPGLLINHLFVAAVMLAIIAASTVIRINHSDLLLAALLPVSGLTIARFALGGEVDGYVAAAIMFLYSVQMYYDGRRLTRRLGEDARLRFQVEDLARELEETRDEALRKRFEAETANASKTAFLANMSHELRTPLNAILGFSEIIAQECFGPTGSPRYKEYAGDIHSSGAHLLSLINDLLDVAKIEAGKMDIDPTPLEVRKTLEGALKIMTPKAREKHQELIIDVEPETPPLYADERALKQILINLVSNACKFTPEGGRIAVVASKAPGGAFQIMVEDNGPGIPREKLDRIFTPFNQVDNRYDRQAGGTGLGLALVRGLSELHGGRAWIESEYGSGCKVFVVLPCEPGKIARQETREPMAARA